MSLLDKNEKLFDKLFSESKDYKLSKILFVDNIPKCKQLKCMNPNKSTKKHVARAKRKPDH
jgi:hypothetical protein